STICVNCTIASIRSRAISPRARAAVEDEEGPGADIWCVRMNSHLRGPRGATRVAPDDRAAGHCPGAVASLTQRRAAFRCAAATAVAAEACSRLLSRHARQLRRVQRRPQARRYSEGGYQRVPQTAELLRM